MDWSQIVAGLVGGMMVLAASLLTLYVTIKANERAEERAETRKLNEEQRDWVRRSRKERMKAVFDFLAHAKEALAAAFADDVVQGVEAGWDAQLSEALLAAGQSEPSEDARREFRQYMREVVDPAGQQFDRIEFGRRAMRALSTASSEDVRKKGHCDRGGDEIP